jgi:hypothetical protein
LHLTPQSDWNVLLNVELQEYYDNYAEFRKLDGIYDSPHDVSLSSNGLAQKHAGGGFLSAWRKALMTSNSSPSAPSA